MTTPDLSLNMDTVKLIATAAADETARRLGEGFRAEQKRDFEEMERRLTDKMDSYFGKLDADKHVIQHDRIERLLAVFDRLGENVFASLLKSVIFGLLALGFLGWLAYKKATGGF